MRPSLQQHTLGRLRSWIKISQAELAAMLGCSLMIIKNIESLRTTLDEEMALRVAVATNVDFAWLVANDLDAPIIAKDGEPYTYEHYLVAQAFQAYGLAWSTGASLHPYRLIKLLQRTVNLVETVNRGRGDLVEVIYWRITQLLGQIETEQGIGQTGTLTGDADDLAKRLKQIIGEDQLSRQIDVRQEVEQRAMAYFRNEGAAARAATPSERASKVWEFYAAALTTKIPNPDPSALTTLQGPSIEHMDAVDAKRAAEKVKPSPTAATHRLRK